MCEVLKHTAVESTFTLLEVSVELFRRSVKVISKRPNEFQEIFVVCCVHVILLKLPGLLELLKCLKEDLTLVG